jgi:hypothetical protein
MSGRSFCVIIVFLPRWRQNASQPGDHVVVGLPRERGKLNWLEKIFGVHIQCRSQAAYDFDSGVPATPLNSPDVGEVDSDVVGELFLGQSPSNAELSDIMSDDLAPIHATTEGVRED